MAISVDSIETLAEQGRCSSIPAQHEVTITSWDYRDHADGQKVVIEVSDDEGARMFLQFGLSAQELSSGELARFITTVLGLQPSVPDGIPPHIFRQMLLNRLVGRRVLLVVVATNRGVQIVIDWEAAPRG